MFWFFIFIIAITLCGVITAGILAPTRKYAMRVIGAMWERDFDFTQPITPVMSPAHQHEFGTGYDLQYKDCDGNVQARLDGLRSDEAAILRLKHKI